MIFNGYMNKNIKNQKGQILLFVIVILTVALSIGVAISTRTLASLSRVTREDTSNKVLSAAESGIETFLTKTEEELNAIEGDTSVTFTDPISGIDTVADITIEKYSSNYTSEGLAFNLDTGYVKDINLDGYTGDIDICWDNNSTALSYIVYKKVTGISEKGIINGEDSTISTNNLSNNIPKANPNTYAAGCETLTIDANTYGVRLRTLYNNANIYVIPKSGTFPIQGHKITSTGKLYIEGKVTTTKKVIVYRSNASIAGIFDDAIYMTEDLN